MYWAQELAAQTENKELADKFAPLAKALTENEKKILGELNSVQGKPVDIGGYYQPDMKKVNAIMRPSATFNAIVDALKA
jgi:isocitrate dehydrogenase